MPVYDFNPVGEFRKSVEAPLRLDAARLALDRQFKIVESYRNRSSSYFAALIVVIGLLLNYNPAERPQALRECMDVLLFSYALCLLALFVVVLPSWSWEWDADESSMVEQFSILESRGAKEHHYQLALAEFYEDMRAGHEKRVRAMRGLILGGVASAVVTTGLWLMMLKLSS